MYPLQTSGTTCPLRCERDLHNGAAISRNDTWHQSLQQCVRETQVVRKLAKERLSVGPKPAEAFGDHICLFASLSRYQSSSTILRLSSAQAAHDRCSVITASFFHSLKGNTVSPRLVCAPGAVQKSSPQSGSHSSASVGKSCAVTPPSSD